MAEVPRIVMPAEGKANEADRLRRQRRPHRGGEAAHIERRLGGWHRFGGLGGQIRRRRAGAYPQRIGDGRGGDVGLAGQMQIHPRQRLVSAAEAVVQQVVERALDDPRANLSCLLQRAGEVEGIERKNHIRLAQHGCGSGIEEGAGARGAERVVGREGGAEIAAGRHAGIQRLGERDAPPSRRPDRARRGRRG